ncbi:MAG: helix-turn-helix transcriptional regulator [Planctomycetota bacterium]
MSDQLLQRFGANLRRIRESAGLSQEALADKTKFHRNFVGLVERGERNTSVTKVAALCEALGCSPNDLFKGVCKRG